MGVCKSQKWQLCDSVIYLHVQCDMPMCIVPCIELQVSCWVHLSVVYLKTGHYAHGHITLLAVKGGSLLSSPLFVAADTTATLNLPAS